MRTIFRDVFAAGIDEDNGKIRCILKNWVIQVLVVNLYNHYLLILLNYYFEITIANIIYLTFLFYSFYFK
jgi:hypothetical protein